jgi:hypothetical protein
MVRQVPAMGGDRVKAQRARAMALDLVGNDAQRGENRPRPFKGFFEIRDPSKLPEIERRDGTHTDITYPSR